MGEAARRPQRLGSTRPHRALWGLPRCRVRRGWPKGEDIDRERLEYCDERQEIERSTNLQKSLMREYIGSSKGSQEPGN